MKPSNQECRLANHTLKSTDIEFCKRMRTLKVYNVTHNIIKGGSVIGADYAGHFLLGLFCLKAILARGGGILTGN